MTVTTFTKLCEPGAVVTVLFQFTSGRGIKSRPAVVLSVDQYHQDRVDTVIVAVTSQDLNNNRFGDSEIIDWQQAGLNTASKAKGVLATIEQQRIKKRVGTLTANDFARLQQSVRNIIGG